MGDRRLAAMLIVLGTVQAHAADLPSRVPVYRAWQGAPKLFVDVTLPDGTQGLFMIDTGAEVSLLSLEAAQRLALPAQGDAVQVAGLTSVTTVDLATLPWIRIGDTIIPEVEVAVDVPGQPDTYGFMPVLGILGNNVWSRFVVDLDYTRDRLSLYAPGSVRLPRQASMMHFDGAHVLVPVQFATVSEPKVHHATVLALDTGAHGLMLRGPTGLALDGVYTEGMEPVYGLGTPQGMPTASYLEPSRRIPLTSVVVGGRRVPVDFDARWLSYGTSVQGQILSVPGLVGFDVLSGHRLMIDYRDQRVALVPSRGRQRFHNGHALLLARDEARYGDDPSRAWIRARLQLGLDRPDDAIASAEAYIAHVDVPTGAEARVMLARLYRSEGRVADAWAALAPLDADTLVDQDEIIATVNGLVLDGHADAARQLAARAVALRPRDARAYIARADAFLAAGQHNEAHADLVQANHLQEDPDANLFRRARVAMARGDHDAALTLLRAGLDRNPLDGKFLWLYAQIARPEDLDLVRADLRRATSRTHPGLRPHDFLLGAHAMLGDAPAVSRLLAEGLAADCDGLSRGPDRDNCEAWYLTLARTHLDEAYLRAQRAVLARPDRGDYLDTLAMVQLARGDVRAAQATALQAARRMPEDPYMLWQVERIAALSLPSPEPRP